MANRSGDAGMDAVPIDPKGFNPRCQLPYGLTCGHIRRAMEEFIDFIGFIDGQLRAKQMPRLASFLMPANFSSMVGEFMHIGIEKHCPTLVKNKYHNGHPDLIPAGKFSGDAVQHSTEGIEIKASRYEKAWQGHNAEDCWLMVFVFESSRPSDKEKGVIPIPFRFVAVYGAQLTKNDWKFAGRSSTSRRTITASVIDSGYQKMTKNWIYRAP
jgi:hypothetical protein